MRYIRVEGSTQFCGTNFEEYLETEMTDEQLEVYCAERARENAEQYEYIVYGWDCSAEDYAEENGITLEEAEEAIEEYYAEATAFWQEISEEEFKEGI